MFNFLAFLPPWAYKVGFAVVGLAIAIGTYHHEIKKAYTEGHTVAVQERELSDKTELVKAVAEAKSKTAALQKTVDNDVILRSITKANNEKQNLVVDNSFRNGLERMRCPGPHLLASTEAGNPPIASGPAPAQGDSVLPEIAIAVLDIARRSAEDVRDYNAVVKLYNDSRAVANGK
jgi:hypothetical protein